MLQLRRRRGSLVCVCAMRALYAVAPFAAQAASGLQEALAENTAVARELRDVRTSLEAAREERGRACALAARASDPSPATCPAVCREAACSSNKVRAARHTVGPRSCCWSIGRWSTPQHWRLLRRRRSFISCFVYAIPLCHDSSAVWCAGECAGRACGSAGGCGAGRRAARRSRGARR